MTVSTNVTTAVLGDLEEGYNHTFRVAPLGVDAGLTQVVLMMIKSQP